MAINSDITTLADLVAQPETLLALDPEELAGVVLKELVAIEKARGSGDPNRQNFSLRYRTAQKEVQQAIMEAWSWLEREGCIAPKPETNGDWVFVTRRGKQLANAQDTSVYKRANLLPRQFLHPVIAQKVWSAFLRGDYDTSVFQAFKQVEVAVRDVGVLQPDEIGVKLMRRAFHPDDGPLRDSTALPAERQALADLFAGAIGSYKNPHSHRNVSLDDPQEAAEMIILASHLLKIVDSRKATGEQP
jgi:uncharacterized protein (TIGR02391 family)